MFNTLNEINQAKGLGLTEYEIRVLTDRLTHSEETVKQFIDLAEKAKNKNEFAKGVLKLVDPQSHTYGVISRATHHHRQNLLEMLKGNDHYFTNSDSGNVLVGTDDFQMNLQNGHGDGETDLFIVKKGEPFNKSMMDYLGAIQGTFKVSKDDNQIDWIDGLSLNGKFETYCSNGIVAIVEN